MINLRNFGAVIAVAASLSIGALACASDAQAATYLLTFSGQDFTSGPISALITTYANGGNVGYPGGPDQLWGEGPLAGDAGWLDLFLGGEGIAFEGSSSAKFDSGAASGLYLTSTSPLFSLTCSVATSANGCFTLASFETGTFDLTNSGWYGCCAAPGSGNLDTLTIVETAVPEPALWAMMLFGFGGAGFMMRGARRKQLSAIATA